MQKPDCLGLKAEKSAQVKTFISFFVSTSLFFCSFFPAYAADAKGFSPLKLDDRLVKWGSVELHSPAHVTYAFVQGPLVQENTRNCRAMDSLNLLSRNTGIALGSIRDEAKAAFRLWEAVSGITFEETESANDANIRIGVQSNPRGYAYTSVQYEKEGKQPRQVDAGGDRGLSKPGLKLPGAPDFVGDMKIAEITQTAICLNPAHNWKIGFDGDLNTYDLRYTFAHEIGHAIGLDHYLRHGSIMDFKYAEQFRSLQPSDIEGAQWLYGPRLN